MNEVTRLIGRIPDILAGSQDEGFAEKCLDDIRANMRDSYGRLGKAVATMLLLAAIFELLARAAIEQASLGPFEVKDLSLIRKALPVIMAFILHELTLLTLQIFEMEEVHDAIYRAAHPDAHSSGLDYFIIPSYPAIFLARTFDAYRSKYDAVVHMHYTITLVLYLGFFGFQIYAYVLQFSYFKADDIAIWVSLALTAYFIISAALTQRKAWMLYNDLKRSDIH